MLYLSFFIQQVVEIGEIAKLNQDDINFTGISVIVHEKVTRKEKFILIYALRFG